MSTCLKQRTLVSRICFCNITNISILESAKINSTTQCLLENAHVTYWTGGGTYELFEGLEGVKRLCEQWAVVRFTY